MTMVSEEEIRQFHLETLAYKDWADRVARNYPDWGFYMPGEPRPTIRWYHHIVGYPPIWQWWFGKGSSDR